jgi:hypothetical protein
MPKWVVAFLCIWLSGCITYHAAVPVTPSQKVELAKDEVLIFGRVIGMPNMRSSIFADSRQPFGSGKLSLAHVPNNGKSMFTQHRAHESWLGQAFIGDFMVSSLTVDKDGFFSSVIPVGEYILLSGWSSTVGFDCRIPGSACYLGALSLASDTSAPRINGRLHPSISVFSELPLAQQRLAAIVADLDERTVFQSPVQHLPCTFFTIGYPPGMEYPPRGKPVIAPGKLAVTASQYSPNPLLDVRAAGQSESTKKGAAVGALEGAIYGAIVPLQVGPLYPFVAPATIAAGLVLGGLSGAISGASAGIDDEQAKILAPAVQKATDGQPIQAALAKRVADKAASAGVDVTLISENGPRKRSEMPDYLDLNSAGYNSVLELSVQKAGFKVHERGDSSLLNLGMLIQVRTQGFGGTGTSEIRLILLQTRVRALDDWIRDDGRLLTQDVDESIEQVSQCLSEALFSR